MRENLIARAEEIQRLEGCLSETAAQLVVLYGRRRIGKTYLINEFFEGRFDFKITGVYEEPREVQLQNFASELSGHLRKEIKAPPDWRSAFSMLQSYLEGLPKDEKHIVFFDEMPWFDTPRSGFLPAFEYFWNNFGCAMHHLVFIVCGSAASWMTPHITQNKGGLFNRQTCTIFLRPFTLGETEQYLHSRGILWSRYDVAECYMILGGIPFYLSLLRRDLSLSANIDNLFFRKRAELWNEFHHLYQTLFKNSDLHVRVVEVLSTKRMGMTRAEISEKTGIPENGDLTKILSNLICSDFVRAYSFFGKKKADMLYQLSDYYSWFYLKFIRDYPGRDEQFWSHSYSSAAKHSWAGFTFEQVCKDHILQIKQKLGISGVLAEQSSWFRRGDAEERGAQIDLIIDRNDHVINLCEIKFSTEEYTIDKDYDRILRNKIGAFTHDTKTKKSIQTTMITTYGLRQNPYSNIINTQVILDDLFS